jgi:hypothetical protein
MEKLFNKYFKEYYIIWQLFTSESDQVVKKTVTYCTGQYIKQILYIYIFLRSAQA